MKKDSRYFAPQIREFGVNAESGFAQSNPKWYEQSGSGDFTYEIENDTDWQ